MMDILPKNNYEDPHDTSQREDKEEIYDIQPFSSLDTLLVVGFKDTYYIALPII